MKRFLCLLLAGSLLLSLTACSKSQSDLSSASQVIDSQNSTVAKKSDLQIKSESIVRDMTNGNYQSIVDNLSDDLKSKCTANQLKQQIETYTASFGKFIDIVKSTEIAGNGSTLELVILKYENNGLQVKIAYSPNDKITSYTTEQYTIEPTLVSNSIYEETKIQIGDSSHPLDGVLTLPKDVSAPPVVILVQGSGVSDMDETIASGTSFNKPFQDIARGLAEKGIASIRYNKRFYQYPELSTKNDTVKDEYLDDVKSAVTFAKDNGSVNPKKIFIAGHSEGGMLAPKFALDNPEVVGIISLAGSPRKLEDITIDQLKNRCQAGLISKDDLTKYESQAQQIKNLTGNEDTTLLFTNSKYWYGLNQIDTPSIVKQLSIPMLILQGSDDTQCYPDVDYNQWKTLLGSRSNVTFHLYNHLNHLFMQSNGQTDLSKEYPAGHVDSQVISDMGDFINNN